MVTLLRRLIVPIVALAFVTSATLTARQPAPGGQKPVSGAPAQLPTPGRDPNAGPAPAPTGTAVLGGMVVDPASGRPVRRARVTATNTSAGGSPAMLTDDQGTFSFTQLPAGSYQLSASKAGYLDSIYGQKDAGSGRPGTVIALTDGQKLDRLSLPLPRGGVLTGRITDDVGDPAYGTTVHAYRWIMKSGERTLTAVGSGDADDRGIYRIPALLPGDYVISATPKPDPGAMIAVKMQVEAMLARAQAAVAAGGDPSNIASTKMAIANMAQDADDGSSTGYAPVYYPGTLNVPTATTVTLGISEEKTGLDLQLQMVPLGKITGTVASGDGRPVAGTQVSLVDMSQVGLNNTRGTSAGPDGKFTFSGIPPGQYTVVARSGRMLVVARKLSADGQTITLMADGRIGGPGATPGEPPPPMWAAADVGVDGRTPATATLVLQPGMTVGGRVTFDASGAPPADLTQIRLMLNPAGPSDPMSSVSGGADTTLDANGNFSLANVMPGKYRVNVSGARGWTLKSFDVNGRDAMDFWLDVKPGGDIANAAVTLTMQSTMVSGSLQDANGQPAPGYTIIVFADDQAYWTPLSRRIQATRPASDGRYSIQGLPPGSYRLVAVDDVDNGEWFDPALLHRLTNSAIALTLGDGERKTQDLRVAK